ncbi:hypothetical protein H6G80_24170 [Nostoc sp. FACHB-87]|uniref:hypothetical protein n=1 Tax=Nostocaceae TaxID=1162 RepID=UPI001689488A|nr:MULTISPECIES: hypothetical protein [Nostocaceae]MBD2457158.1 hypothetical protein [Nostoc sp. FACHB-87]MBD2476976.1 hypothetical protein [Anabaena sp. FACHB-83]
MMSPNNKNLWGELPKNVEVRTPYLILKEQASILTQMTKGLLIGEVDRKSLGQNIFFVSLRIRVPALNSYTYSVVDVRYPLKLYPLAIKDYTSSEQEVQCSSEQEFELALGKILSSEQVKRVISTLLAEIQSGDELQEDAF